MNKEEEKRLKDAEDDAIKSRRIIMEERFRTKKTWDELQKLEDEFKILKGSYYKAKIELDELREFKETTELNSVLNDGTEQDYLDENRNLRKSILEVRATIASMRKTPETKRVLEELDMVINKIEVKSESPLIKRRRILNKRWNIRPEHPGQNDIINDS